VLDVPLCGFSTGVNHGLLSYGENEIVAVTCGMLVDYVNFMSEHEKSISVADARKYLSSSMVRRLKEESNVAMMGGIDKERIDNALRSVRRTNHTLTLGYGGSFDSYKRFDDMLEIYKTIAAIRRVRVVCTTGNDLPTADRLKLVRKYPGFEFHSKVSKDQYFAMLKEWDLGLCLSPAESMGTGYLEMMHAGVVLVGLKSAFFEEITPDGYPFIGKNLAEIPGMLMLLIDNPKLRKEAAIDVRDYIATTYDNERHAYQLLEWLEETVQKHYTTHKGWSGTSLQKKVAGVMGELTEPVSLSDFGKALKLCTPKSDYMKPGSLIGPFYLRWLILSLGYRDLCDGPEPKFVKPFSTSPFSL
jgi:glycosyltransferase involved in cell wall biosynthesis